MLAALVAALAFHLVPTPDDLGITSEFQLQGYTVPAACTAAADEAGKCARFLADHPMFVPESQAYRPLAHVSFVAPVTGTCGAVQTETVDGHTSFVIAARAATRAGHRYYLDAALTSQDDVRGDDWAMHVRDRYRIAVMCISDDGKTRVPSAFYEVARPR